jgi:hypothetical protein
MWNPCEFHRMVSMIFRLSVPRVVIVARSFSSGIDSCSQSILKQDTICPLSLYDINLDGGLIIQCPRIALLSRVRSLLRLRRPGRHAPMWFQCPSHPIPTHPIPFVKHRSRVNFHIITFMTVCGIDRKRSLKICQQCNGERWSHSQNCVPGEKSIFFES